MEEEEYLDRELAIKLRDRMEHEASVRWWQLFGLEGHRLDSVEAEAQYISLGQNLRARLQASSLLRPIRSGDSTMATTSAGKGSTTV